MSIASRISVWADGESPTPPAYWGMYFEAEEPNVVVNMAKSGSPAAVSLESSIDGDTWITFDAEGGTTPITLTQKGDRVYFRAGSSGNTRFSNGTNVYHYFTLSGSAGAYGNIMSLISGSDQSNVTITQDYCFNSLFYSCTKLTTSPILPATTIRNYCYYQMFYGCTSLTTPPALPATTTRPSCYSNMFSGCTSLTSPPTLSATTLGTYCYESMFRNCTSLSSAPALPAATLSNSCYRRMFSGCKVLTSAPRLPATLLVSGCYQYMFDSCTNLRAVEVEFTSWGGETASWLSGVSSSGTFRCPAALGNNSTISRGNSYCPSGWTVVNI